MAVIQRAAQTPARAPMPRGADANAAGRAVPFVRGALKARQSGTPQSTVLSTAVQSQSHIIPALGGWNRRISLQVACVTAANAAAVTFAADGPWNVFSQVLLKDANQKQLVLLRGYDLYLTNLFGGYFPFPNITGDTRSYSAVTGAGATGGSFSYTLVLPEECSRDGIAAYPNMDSSQRLTVDLTIVANATIYGTPPTTPGTLTVTPIVYYYSNPAAVDADGMAVETEPAGAGTVQYWRTVVQQVSSGNNTLTFPLSGRYIRNMLALFTDGSDVRSDTVRPTTIRWEIDNNVYVDAPMSDWDATIFRHFGVVTPTGFTPLYIGTLDPDGNPGGEWADDWIGTSTASQLVIKFSAGAAGKIYLLLNEIEPVGDVFR